MECFAKYSKRYLSGKQRITQRIEPCTCGCEGQDSWHAATMKRVVREVEVFDTPHRSNTYMGYETTLCAVAKYKHPSGWRPCGLEAHRLRDGSWLVGSWVTLDSIDGYGTANPVVKEGAHVDWRETPEGKALLGRLKEEEKNDTDGSSVS